VVVHGGGTLEGRSSVVDGQVEYALGEEVVAFLVRNSRGEGVTIGLMQGKFHIWQDKATGARFVTSPFHGAPQAASAGTRVQATTSGGGALWAPLGLAELKKRVLEASG